jgi:Xaa-Pro aminopeptidase
VTLIQRALAAHNLDAIACTVPSNVLLLSGYWPVIGNAIAVATRDGVVGVLAPDDEEGLATAASWADVIHTFTSGSLQQLTTAFDNVRGPLSQLSASLHLRRAVIGFEGRESFDTSRYAATFSYGAGLHAVLSSSFAHVALVDATDVLADLRATLTPRELDLARQACAIAKDAFVDCAPQFAVGMHEADCASLLRRHLCDDAHARADGFAYCMSGPNSARAYAAFQHSSARAFAPGDVVLVHCNSYCEGFWTDLTRTFTVGSPDGRVEDMLHAILAARQEALAAIRPGVRASTVDAAARDVMTTRGFGAAFKHPTGHGIGFAAINHHAQPRIHPRSDDVLETGMVFNIEPAAYVADYGMRHCDMVAVTDTGAELLSDFQSRPEELHLTSSARIRTIAG